MTVNQKSYRVSLSSRAYDRRLVEAIAVRNETCTVIREVGLEGSLVGERVPADTLDLEAVVHADITEQNCPAHQYSSLQPAC